MPVSQWQRSMARELSWNLTIDSIAIVVTGSMSIATVMMQLVNRLDVTEDYSDHALWWPKASIWLTNTRRTLDQYGIQADSYLTFTTMHKLIRLQLPDLRILSHYADFSVSVYVSVCKICKDFGIRHAEELSILRLPKVSNANENRASFRRRRDNSNTLHRHHSMGDSLATNTLAQSTSFSSATLKLRSTATIDKITEPSSHSHYSTSSLSKSLNLLSTSNDGNLARTPLTTRKNLLPQIMQSTNLIEKSKLNSLWLDSSKSLMEQDINENDVILLRFKYYSFYDLNPKVDAIRINQLYEQAKWSIINEDIDCTDEEMITFAALQLQIQIQSSSSSLPTINSNYDVDPLHQYDNYDIDQALEHLQNSLLGKTQVRSVNSTRPLNIQEQIKQELRDYLRIFKSRRFAFKSYKRYWFVLSNSQLTYYTNESRQYHTPIEKISLRGCEV
ncbi:unnamed protein product, partial [Rotaria magnacalcarata]